MQSAADVVERGSPNSDTSVGSPLFHFHINRLRVGSERRVARLAVVVWWQPVIGAASHENGGGGVNGAADRERVTHVVLPWLSRTENLISPSSGAGTAPPRSMR